MYDEDANTTVPVEAESENNEELEFFFDDKVRKIWHKQKEEWYFSIVDVCQVLTDSADGRKYWNKLKQRLLAEGNETVTNCHQLKMKASDGKMRKTDCATTEQLLRIIQSIPSKKAEPFKLWLAKVGKERLDEKMSIIKNTPKHEVKNADLDLLREMKIADEMYARGYEFWPLDIYKAKAKDFQVIDGKIMPALTSIDGMGEKAAQQVEEAAKGEPFTSLENFRNRTKAPQACIEKMKELGIMGDLSDTDQLSFDFL